MRSATFFVGCLAFITTLSGLSRAAVAEGFPESYVESSMAEVMRGLTVDVGALAEGEMIRVQFAGRPVYIYRRTEADLASLQRGSAGGAEDPGQEVLRTVRKEYSSASAKAWARLLLAAEPISTRPLRTLDSRFFVGAGWAPMSGCALILAQSKKKTDTAAGFYDPCTTSAYDTAGRLLQVKGAPDHDALNISIPPYEVVGDKIVLGYADDFPELPFSREELYSAGSVTERLIDAARYNDIDEVRKAIGQGADVNYFAPGKGSPIGAAIIGGSTPLVELLIQHGARPQWNSEAIARSLGRNDVLELLQKLK